MGEKSVWQCPSCGYRELVTDGVETGRTKAVATIACDECQQLIEVVLRERSPLVLELLDRCPAWEPDRLRCPYDRRHRVVVWRYGDPCPRCGDATERDASEPVLRFD